ncbi:unnamed protein product [Haemonchus placei]|uniref:Uncharacterized protein n=1 Tax=Haemonchus placei TaxID=6290 RepID=A0A0N4VS82_HAEPC|nr:unnamed protein product [Haemonchus placei]
MAAILSIANAGPSCQALVQIDGISAVACFNNHIFDLGNGSQLAMASYLPLPSADVVLVFSDLHHQIFDK